MTTKRRTPTPEPTLDRPLPEVLPWHAASWRQLLAQQRSGRVPHALLLHGPTGTGKLRFAYYLALSRLCRQADEQGRPCGQCSACKLFQAGSHPDFRLVEAAPGKRVIRVHQVRAVSDWVVQRPHYGGPKLLLLPVAEQMNPAAANALLKTLEEPVGDTLIVLVSARPAGLLATIRSRCQALALSAPDAAQALAWLRQQAEVEGLATGASTGDAGGDPVLALALGGGAPLSALQALRDDLVQPFTVLLTDIIEVARGKDPITAAEYWSKQETNRVVGWMLEMVQAMIRIRMGGDPLAWEPLRELAGACPVRPLFEQLDRLGASQAQMNAGQNPNPQLLMESLFIPWQAIVAGQSQRHRVA